MNMKSRFKFIKPTAVDTEENILPLINIVFLLLIFFLVAGAMSTPDLFYVEPPVSDSETSVLQTDATVLISEGAKVSFQNELIELDDLYLLAAEVVKASPTQPFTLKVDGMVNSGEAIRAMEILRNAGVQKTLLITSKDG
jgi:biopolymer transport protein ExbD